jgi:hypothetical protein
MNKKQLFCMWCGIAVFVFVGLITVASSSRYPFLDTPFQWKDYAPLLIVYWPSVAVVTGGLIWTLRDKKRPEDSSRKILNFNRGFRRITFVLAIIVGLISSLIPVPVIVSARDYVQRHERQLEYFMNNINQQQMREFFGMNIKEFRSKFPKCDDINDLDLSNRLYEKFHFRFAPDDPNLVSKNSEYNIFDVVEQRKRLEEAKKDFWAKLSTVQASALCILIGIAGFCGVWLIYLSFLLIHKLVKWVRLGFSHSNA